MCAYDIINTILLHCLIVKIKANKTMNNKCHFEFTVTNMGVNSQSDGVIDNAPFSYTSLDSMQSRLIAFETAWKENRRRKRIVRPIAYVKPTPRPSQKPMFPLQPRHC